MAINCYTGTGANLAASGSNDDALINGLNIESIGAYPNNVEALPVRPINVPADRTVRPTQYCITKHIDADAFEVVVYHDPNNNYAQIIGDEFTLTHVQPDGSTLAGMASCVSAELSGDETAGEVVTATLSFIFLEGGVHSGTP